MGDGRKKSKIEREERLRALSTKREQEDRRSKMWIYGTGAVLIIVLIVTVTSIMLIQSQDKNRLSAAAKKPINGVQSFAGLTRNHTLKQIPNAPYPPAGGDHSPEFINCGIYPNSIDTAKAVHSLEHGAVWITYQPDLPQTQIDALTKEAASHPYELLSPYPGLSSPIVATAWGKQLSVQSASDPRLPVFLQAYLQGPQTPEPGAPCTGGVQG
ncbi:MAG: DUF3105 domain-containing protein [Actinobacteria bacterium]|nr:DUF3105 domain-containing protein [Actinomycetota bacterium]